MLRIYGGEIHKYRSISKVYDSVTGLNARRDDLGSLGTQFDERFAWSNCVYRFDWLKALGNIFWGGSIERLIFVRGRGGSRFVRIVLSLLLLGSNPWWRSTPNFIHIRIFVRFGLMYDVQRLIHDLFDLLLLELVEWCTSEIELHKQWMDKYYSLCPKIWCIFVKKIKQN